MITEVDVIQPLYSLSFNDCNCIFIKGHLRSSWTCNIFFKRWFMLLSVTANPYNFIAFKTEWTWTVMKMLTYYCCGQDSFDLGNFIRLNVLPINTLLITNSGIERNKNTQIIKHLEKTALLPSFWSSVALLHATPSVRWQDGRWWDGRWWGSDPAPCF